MHNCKKHSFLLGRIINIKEFSGSSPPEIFVGRYGYPDVNIGILSPIEHGDTSLLSSAEEWHKANLSINQIVNLRNQLIYGRTKANIKRAFSKQFTTTMQEVAMTHKSISAEFRLKKSLAPFKEKDNKALLITNSAQIETVSLEENPKIIPKIEYLTSDTDLKSRAAILELDKARISSQHIMKILSAGLLGLGNRRKLVPTRWSITAVDSTLSEEKLKAIRYFPEIQNFLVFTSEYLGNHYEFLLIPSTWEFEVIEISLANQGIWQDYEGFFKRKNYADSVTGAYYANRLALTEYLSKIRRQCACIVFREVRPEYNTPLGVGILREASRAAFQAKPKTLNTLQEALADIQERLKQPITNYTIKSNIIKNYGKQTRLNNWFN